MSSKAVCPAVDLPAWYTWRFPGAPVKVRLALSVVERITADLRERSDADARGFLLGQAVRQVTEVDGFRHTGNNHEPPASDAVDPAGSAEEQVVGYFKVTEDAALRLSDADLAFAQSALPHPYQVFLLIQRTEGKFANATFFFWDHGRMWGECSFLEFPFDAGMLAVAEQSRIRPATDRRSVPSEVVLAPAITPQVGEPVRRRVTGRLKVLVWVATGFLTAMVLLAVAASVRTVARYASLRMSEPAKSSGPPPSSLLGLQAQRQGADLRLTWDRNAEAVRSATGGVLTLTDGAGIRRIELRHVEVRAGSILYAPVTDQIYAQLILSGPRNSISESIVILLPRAAPSGAAPDMTAEPGKPARKSASGAAASRKEKPVSAAEARTPPGEPQGDGPAHSAPDGLAALIQRPLPYLHILAETPPVGLAPVSTPAAAKDADPDPSAGAHSSLPPVSRPARNAVPQQPGASGAEPRDPMPATPGITRAYYPPELEKRAPLSFPSPLKTLLMGSKTVEVKVDIDATGRVTKAEALPSETLIPQLMISAAVNAARLYRFKPARRGSEPISSQMVLQFQFAAPR